MLPVCILRNLRIDIKDRLEEYSQSIEIDILIKYGDLQPQPEVVRYPHCEVPYPTSNGDNNI